MLTFAYFIVEVIINYNIYRQLSFSSSLMAIEALEFWGKIVTGLGLALVVTRLSAVSPDTLDRNAALSRYTKNPIKTFLYLCIICIPLSFFLQNQIISKIVDSSTPDEQNRALLVANVQKTIVPYYDFTNTSSEVEPASLLPHQKFLYPFGRKPTSSYNPAHEDYYKYRRYYISASKKCVPVSRETLGMQNDLDRVFFSYSALGTAPERAEAYKAIIKDHYECLLDNPSFQKTHTANIPYSENIIIEMYKEHFVPGSTDWSAGASHSRAAADKAWRKKADMLFGFKTSIKPYVGDVDEDRFDYFTSHPDVRRFYSEKTGPDAKSLYPYDKGFNERKTAFIVDRLPYALMPTYLDYTPSSLSITGYEMSDKAPQEHGLAVEIDGPTSEDVGKAAYKAVVMPMVAMGLSAFFLVFNIILFTSSVVKTKVSSKAAAIYLILAVSFAAIPLIAPSINSFGNNSLMRDQALKTKWLYHQESVLAKAYRLFDN